MKIVLIECIQSPITVQQVRMLLFLYIINLYQLDELTWLEWVTSSVRCSGKL